MKENKIQYDRENCIEGIDEEFQDLASQLKNIDFSKESNKNYVLNKSLKNIYNRGDSKMNRMKKVGVAAASLLIVSTLVSQATFAQETVNKIIKSISLGHVTMVQDDVKESEEVVMPDSLKGRAFDKNGKLIEKLTKDIKRDGIYDKDGKQITEFTLNDGTVAKIISKKDDNSRSKNNLYVTDSSKLNEYTCFDVKLPSYLPDGYTFDRAEFYRDKPDEEVKDSKYAQLYFKNKGTGKEISLQERFACDETKTVANGDNIEKININGANGILSNDRNIDWEVNNTIYFLGGKNIGKDEAIKIAESIK